jgi:hypothetical protein
MINHLDVIHSDWFIYNLREQCIPVDFCNLRRVSKYYNKNITQNDITITIINSIQKRLQQILGQYYDKFMKYIEKNGINISGSFIIQCILGEYYDDSDIDLYTGVEIDNDAFLEMFTESDLKIMKQEFFEIYGDLDIDSIANTYLKNNYKLQHIYTNANASGFENFKNEFITKQFDFDICKNIFTIIDGKPILYMYNLKKILNKQEVISVPTLNDKIINRITRYETRGFTFKYKIELSNYIVHKKCVYPFIVFKNNKIADWNDKLTFLGLIFNRVDAACFYNLYDGNVVLCNDIAEYRNRTCSRPYVANMKNIFKYIFEEETFNKQKCTDCKLSTILGIPHFCMDCELYHGVNRNRNTNTNTNIKIMNFIIINYDDMNDKMKLQYDELFSTKICNGKFKTCASINGYQFQNAVSDNNVSDDDVSDDDVSDNDDSDDNSDDSNISDDNTIVQM